MMATIDDDDLTAADIQAALDGLAAAQRRAQASGRPIVVVEDGKLVRRGPGEYTVLRVLPPRESPKQRIKTASSLREQP